MDRQLDATLFGAAPADLAGQEAQYLAYCRDAHREAMRRWPDWAATLPQATRDQYASEQRASDAAPTAKAPMPARALHTPRRTGWAELWGS